MRLPDLEAWAIFAAVVEHRSFSAAARALTLSKATVSKAVTRLETRLATPLFHRTSRKLSLTEAGKALAPRAAAMLEEARAAENLARDEASVPGGLVRLAAPMSFGLKHLGPILAEFLAAHPAISIDIELSDKKVDIIAEGFDIVVRIGTPQDSSLLARLLGGMPGMFVAAPAYLAQYGEPHHPAELVQHRCFTYTNLANPSLWRLKGPDGEIAAVKVSGPVAANSGDIMLAPLRAGLGIALLPQFIIEEDLASGDLVPILPEWSNSDAAAYLLTPPGTYRPLRVDMLADFLTVKLRELCAIWSA